MKAGIVTHKAAWLKRLLKNLFPVNQNIRITELKDQGPVDMLCIGEFLSIYGF